MTFSDIGVIAIIYATCLLFFFLTLDFSPAAQIYPMCLIAGLALLNTLYLGRCVFKQMKSTAQGPVNDFPGIFKGFLPTQFFFVLATSVAYLILLYCIGFYLSGLIYLACVLFWFKVRPLYAIITISFMGILIYAVFTLFLKVPLPQGILFN